MDWFLDHSGALLRGRLRRRLRAPSRRSRGSVGAGHSGSRRFRLARQPEPAAGDLVRRHRTEPGHAAGAVKSHEFSDRPIKSRIAGSADQARRSAARVRSAGTPGGKKSADVGPGTDRIDRAAGRQDRTWLRVAAARRDGAAAAAGRARSRSCGGLPARGLGTLAARPAREKAVVSAHCRALAGAASRQRFGIGAVALALLRTRRSTWCSATKAAIASRTGSGIATASTIACPGSVRAFAFRRIGGRRGDFIGRLAAGRLQRHPERGGAGRQIAAIIVGLRAIELDFGGAGVERRASPPCSPGASTAAPRAGRRAPRPAARRNRPRASAPCAARPRCRPECAAAVSRRTHATGARRRTGKPVSRFCGFRRSILSMRSSPG